MHRNHNPISTLSPPDRSQEVAEAKKLKRKKNKFLLEILEWRIDGCSCHHRELGEQTVLPTCREAETDMQDHKEADR